MEFPTKMLGVNQFTCAFMNRRFYCRELFLITSNHVNKYKLEMPQVDQIQVEKGFLYVISSMLLTTDLIQMNDINWSIEWHVPKMEVDCKRIMV